MKINGMMLQPTKNGMRQPQAAIVGSSSAALSAKPRSAATKIATCWLADWNEVY
jgi:hypothetical protein